MQSQLIDHNLVITVPHKVNFDRCSLIGNLLMAISLFIVTICLIVSFAIDNQFSLVTLVFSHILTIVFAGLLKVGYVLRCIGLYEQGKSNF